MTRAGGSKHTHAERMMVLLTHLAEVKRGNVPLEWSKCLRRSLAIARASPRLLGAGDVAPAAVHCSPELSEQVLEHCQRAIIALRALPTNAPPCDAPLSFSAQLSVLCGILEAVLAPPTTPAVAALLLSGAAEPGPPTRHWQVEQAVRAGNSVMTWASDRPPPGMHGSAI